MMKWMEIFPVVVALLSMASFLGCAVSSSSAETEGTIELPKPVLKGKTSVEEALRKRRSRRSFSNKTLTVAQAAQVLWAGQGITGDEGQKRAAPSAGATYPLELYVVIGEDGCEGIPPGVYRYVPQKHALVLHVAGDQRRPLVVAAMNQGFAGQAPMVIIVAAEFARTTGRYGQRAGMYVHMEAGHVGQNVHLQSEAMGLGTCMVGAFDDSAVSDVLKLPAAHKPLYLMPVGYPR